MSRLALLGLCVAALFSARCLIQDPRSVESGGKFTINIANPEGNTLTAGTYEAKTIAGFYNGGDKKPGTDAGYTTVTGTPNVLDQETCKSIGLGFVGKAEAGKTWQLAYFGVVTDGGVSDAGTGGATAVGYANGLGTLAYIDGCLGKTPTKTWRSSAGTLTIVSVEEPSELPQGAQPGANKTVKFTYSGVTMSADEGATGSFSASGEGEILLMAGMNQ